MPGRSDADATVIPDTASAGTIAGDQRGFRAKAMSGRPRERAAPCSKDYPSEYPSAELKGPCPTLSGTFENAGTEVPIPQKPKPPPLLTGALFPPGVIPRSAQVARVRLHGPAQNEFEMAALSGDDRLVAKSSLVQAKSTGNPPERTKFTCTGNYVDIQTGEKADSGGGYMGTTTTHRQLFRAGDGSLIVLEEEEHAGFSFIVPVQFYKHKYWRYVQVADASPATSLAY